MLEVQAAAQASDLECNLRVAKRAHAVYTSEKRPRENRRPRNDEGARTFQVLGVYGDSLSSMD